MTDRPREREYVTVTVTGSKPLFHANGTTALLFQTLEMSSIAFLVDLKAIGVIRQHLERAEAFLLQQTGNA